MNDLPRQSALECRRLPQPRKIKIEATKTPVNRHELAFPHAVNTAAECRDRPES